MFRGVVIVALLAGLALPATAAAERPGVTTGGTANLTDTSVSLNGSVNPRGKDTQYFFQYGLNKLYGAQTPATGAGAANGASAISVAVGALAPAKEPREVRDGQRLGRGGGDHGVAHGPQCTCKPGPT